MSQDLTGEPAAAQTGMWQDEVVSVPLTDSAVRIEDGVDFSVDLDKVPVAARLSLKESGLPLGKHIAVWINVAAGRDDHTRRARSARRWFLDRYFQRQEHDELRRLAHDGAFYVPVSFLTSGREQRFPFPMRMMVRRARHLPTPQPRRWR